MNARLSAGQKRPPSPNDSYIPVKRDMADNGNITVILSVPGTKCGLIIGKNGETIKSLQDTLGVKLLLIQESQAVSQGPKPLRITGTPDNVENAKRTIEQIITSEEGQRPNIVKSVGEVIVPRTSVGIIIGKSGATIKRLINETGCRIQFKPDDDPAASDRCATLQGSPEQIHRATQMIADLLRRSQNGGAIETFLMHVPANKTGLVIGKGGDTIKQICNESGAHVELSKEPQPNPDEKVFIIKGTAYQIHHAQHIIRIKVGDVPLGTPLQQYGGGAPMVPATAYASQSYDGQNQWQPNGSYANQNDANLWSSYYQQQLQHQQQQGAPPQDYSAQWAEYYRNMGLHEKAAILEEQLKKKVL